MCWSDKMVFKTVTLWLSCSVSVTSWLSFQLYHVSAWRRSLDVKILFQFQGPDWLQQVFDVRGAQCSSQRRRKMKRRANKVGADWQLSRSQKPLRNLSPSISLVMRPHEHDKIFRDQTLNLNIIKFFKHVDKSVISLPIVLFWLT